VHLQKTEIHLNKVGLLKEQSSYRTKIIRSMVLKMEDLVKPAIQSVLVDGDIKLHPKRFENTYAHWLFAIEFSSPSGGATNRLFLRRWERGFCGS
jgi:valyl-tRNA synthetase